MNWKQLYTSATEQERLEIMLTMLQAIETRQNKIIFISTPSPNGALAPSHLGRVGEGLGFIRNRRRTNQYHFINDQRGRYTISRIASIISILASLLTVSTATLLFAIHAPAHVALQILFFPATAIIFIFLFKPKRQMLKANR